MRTVLVVEDDLSIRELMSELLREEGFDRVLSAETPEAALRLAMTNALDLVVLDHLLGQHSGIEVAERLRALSGFDSPVLVTTALPLPEAEEVCEEAKACECVPKPFDIEAFLDAVRACLRKDRPTVAA